MGKHHVLQRKGKSPLKLLVNESRRKNVAKQNEIAHVERLNAYCEIAKDDTNSRALRQALDV